MSEALSSPVPADPHQPAPQMQIPAASLAPLGNRRFEALDGLRGLAAVLVVIYHLSASFPGYLAVDLFFVLSGFVLSYRYFDPRRPRLSLSDFCVSRLARLYPLHLFTLFMIAQVYIHTDSTPEYGDGLINTFVQHLLMLHNISLNTVYLSWNEPSWSISVEFWVNLLVFAWLAWPRALVLMLLSLGSYVLLANQAHHLDVNYGALMGLLNGGLVRCLGGFCLGMLVYRVWLWLQSRPALQQPGFWPLGLGRLRGLAMSLLEAGSLALSASLFVLLNPFRTSGDFVAPFCFAALVLVFASEAGLISRLLRLLRLHWLGAISYSLYLNHFWLMVWYRKMGFPAAGWSWHILYDFGIPLTVLSILTLLLVERPLQRSLLSIWRRLRPGPDLPLSQPEHPVSAP